MCFGLSITPVLRRMLTKMATSKAEPSLGLSAGARFTSISLSGKGSIELTAAARTLSFASFTALSGKPTISKQDSLLSE